jgi:hypothetical protein
MSQTYEDARIERHQRKARSRVRKELLKAPLAYSAQELRFTISKFRDANHVAASLHERNDAADPSMNLTDS